MNRWLIDLRVIRLFLVGLHVLCIGLALTSAPAHTLPAAQCAKRANKPVATDLERLYAKKLQELQSCKVRIDARTPCNVFLGRALHILFGNEDFKTGDDAYMLANDIVNGLSQAGNSGWRVLGAAAEQAVLDTAQEIANIGLPVVAARIGQRRADGSIGPGHVAIILPGTLAEANFDGHSWGNLRAPNAASYFLDQPDKLFVGCPLSAAWRSPRGVVLYSKQ